MSGRPDVSELIMNPLFGQAAGQPFDSELAEQSAHMIAQLLQGHPNVGTDTPQVIGTEIADAVAYSTANKPSTP